MAEAYGMKKQSLNSGEGTLVTDSQSPYLLPKISSGQNRNLLKKKNTQSLSRLETATHNVYRSEELVKKPKLFSSTSERKLVSLNESKVISKEIESAY